jgi:hypothetical protein
VEYILKHKDVEVAGLSFNDKNIIDNIVTVYNKDHFPAGVVQEDGRIHVGRIEDWWVGRGIPGERERFYEVLKEINVKNKNELLIKSFGISLTDHYWVCPKDVHLKWKEVNFYENDFSFDIGDAFFYRSKKDTYNLRAPDNSSDGKLIKRWSVIDGKRMLIKGGSSGNYQEPFNEAITSSICQRLNIPHVKYDLLYEDGEYYSICENMTNGEYELVYASHIFEALYRNINDSFYRHYIKCCDKLNIKNIIDRLNKMMVVDYIIANTDRHFSNFGAIRNSETLEYVYPAPVYDSGTSLWHDKNINDINENGIIGTKCFESTHFAQIKLVTDFSWYDKNKLVGIEDEYLELLLKNAHFEIERKKRLALALRKRIEMLDAFIKSSRPQNIS